MRFGPGSSAAGSFPLTPEFAERAGPVLDLYQGRWEGGLLRPGDFVIYADEKPSIQARARIHGTLPPALIPRPAVEHTYERMGALTHLAALDISRRAADNHASSAAPSGGRGSPPLTGLSPR